MQEIELLKVIRPVWLKRAVQALAPAKTLRENFRPELERFFDRIEQAVEAKSPGFVDGIIADWSTSQTQSELQSSASSLTEILNTLMILSFEVCKDTLGEDDSFTLILPLMVIYGHAFSCAAELDAQAKVNFVSNQLSLTNQSLEKNSTGANLIL